MRAGSIALIGCTSLKRATECEARDLYRGQVFRGALVYAARECSKAYILSARYGLVGLDERIAPYNETLMKMSARARSDWGMRVVGALLARGDAEREWVLLAGGRYAEAVIEGLERAKLARKEAREVRITMPLRGLTFGYQAQWARMQREAV